MDNFGCQVCSYSIIHLNGAWNRPTLINENISTSDKYLATNTRMKK